MAVPSLSEYTRFHQDRVNLLIHIFAVPTFALAPLGVIWGVVGGRWLLALVFALLPAVSLAVQGYGHKREPNPPCPSKAPVIS